MSMSRANGASRVGGRRRISIFFRIRDEVLPPTDEPFDSTFDTVPPVLSLQEHMLLRSGACQTQNQLHSLTVITAANLFAMNAVVRMEHSPIA